MADLLALSASIIDSGDTSQAVNRVTTELSEVADGIAVVESFSHVWAVRTDAGLVLADTSAQAAGPAVVRSLRTWSDDAVDTILYTHGHVDHVGGARAFVAEAAERARRRPVVVGHEAVDARFDRYDLTNGYNGVINQRQFRLAEPYWMSDWVRPDTTFRDALELEVGGVAFCLHHAKGETDDHAWAWLPSHRAVLSGDFLTWVFPNAGNPQKVQRYPREWAEALRAMAAMEPELLLPAHGLPIGGAARVAMVLRETADALDHLVAGTLERMNAGARLDEIVHEVRLPDDVLAKPWLRPVYDEPEFVVRNIWRLYGGWYDGNPANLKPAPEAALAAELAALAGGVHRLAARGRSLAEAGDLRLACHLVELAVLADPEDAEAHRARAEVYDRRRREELSLMAKGIYRAAAEESTVAAGGEGRRGDDPFGLGRT